MTDYMSTDVSTPRSSGHEQLYSMCEFQKLYLYIFMLSNYINDFKLILMFSIFMLDDTYLQTDPKDMDLGHILDDVDLKNSKNIRDAVQKAKTKLNQEVINLLISDPQMTQDEIEAKIDHVLLKVKCLDVSCKLFNDKSIPNAIFFPIRI